MKFVVAFMVLVAVAGAQAQSQTPKKGLVFENVKVSNITKTVVSPIKKKK